MAKEEAVRLFEGAEGIDTLPARSFIAEGISVWFTPVEDKTLESWKEVAFYPFQNATP